MNIAQHTKTPMIAVVDNRLLTVREIQYYRHPNVQEHVEERITRHQYGPQGTLQQSIDTRLYTLRQQNSLIKPNFTYLTTTGGSVLRTNSSDAGTTISLNDIEGRPKLVISAPGTSEVKCRRWHYESEQLEGRLLSISEQMAGEAARITERFMYAGNTEAEKDLNLAGVSISHYDTAGLTQTNRVALTGIPLSITRRLLKDADNPDVVADWQGADASAWNDLLAGEAYTTLATTDSLGAVLTNTDAKGNLQRVAYDVAGQLSGSWLTVKGGTEQVIVKSLTYSAAGQKLCEVHGNGVVTTSAYEAETQRLIGIKVERPAGHVSGAKVLQDLRYQYDPVGNVLKISNDAEETRFWRNQKVVPENTYVYDSLYQLISATGREMANIGHQGSSLPSAIVPLPTDSAAYTNYTRTYTYDNAGNLTQVRHSAPATNNSYTTDITVSDRSNRGVLNLLTECAADVDALFMPGGQQKQLQPGQELVWSPRNELLQVTPVLRDGIKVDRESYRYDAGSQRLLKVSVRKLASITQMQRTLYLPGLELRTTTAGDAEKEGLQVMTVGEAGRAQVRVLHWGSGRPAGITGDQVRYSYDNLTGSSQLELDGGGSTISQEEYYPYGGTAVWAARSAMEAEYKTVRYSGKERDATGLYYYGFRYYQPWAGRWLSADPGGAVDGLNLFRMCRNNPISLVDPDGLTPVDLVDRIRRSFRKTNNLKASSLKNTGPFYTRAESGIDIDFLFSRQDTKTSFSPQRLTSLRAEDKRSVIEVASGENITNENRSSKWYAGTYWDKNPLNSTTDLVVLHNGLQGAAGIDIDMADIKPGRSVLVTAGTLSGCTMITGVKGNHFYALHAGTATPTGEWQTKQHGVRDNIKLFNELIPDNGLSLDDISSERNNNDLLPILNFFDMGTISYSGKSGAKIRLESDNVVSYHSTGLGVSFSLLARHTKGGISASTLQEVGDISNYSPARTKGEFNFMLLKYKALHSNIVKLL